MSLMDNLRDAKTMIDSAIADLQGDPDLERNWHWRENLADAGYRIGDLLGEDSDE